MHCIFILAYCVFLSIKSFATATPVEFVIVVASYNNEQWCHDNIKSIAKQRYPHWSMIYINDNSTDNTGALVEQLVKKYKIAKRSTIIHNKVRMGALANMYNAITASKPRSVIVLVDGDDQLATPNALDIIAKAYTKKNAWITYGSYKSVPAGKSLHGPKFPNKVIESNSFRSYKWISSHVKTFYAKLFHMIRKEDLQHEGKFLSSASDLALMFPMLEMASKGHIVRIKKLLYFYNRQNPISDFRIHTDQQGFCAYLVSKIPPYQPLEQLFE